jgi:hypothetical protein
MSTQVIDRYQLTVSLKQVARVRSFVTKFSLIPLVLLTGLLIPILRDLLGNGHAATLVVLAIVITIGGANLVSFLMTKDFCRAKVLCPNCGLSLWDCGTNHFKPKRIKVRYAATCCPGCKIPIS